MVLINPFNGWRRYVNLSVDSVNPVANKIVLVRLNGHELLTQAVCLCSMLSGGRQAR